LSTISRVLAREVLDSRGTPTVEVDVILADGALGRALVPSGASTGSNEALELRDGDARFGGLGVMKAIANVHREIAPAIVGLSALEQQSVDETLIRLDGTLDKSRLGGNAMVGVSIATARAAAASSRVPLYRYLSDGEPLTLPVPMFNILNGGRHAEDSTDFQEFMVVPAGFDTFREALRAGAEVYQSMKRLMRERGFGTTVGDEGGFAPGGITNRDAVGLVTDAIEGAGYIPGEHCFVALDVAASEFVQDDGTYLLQSEGLTLTSEGLIDTYEAWLSDYPIISIEDGMGEADWDGWTAMTERLGYRVSLVGDDLYTTNPALIRRGIETGASNSVLIKLNQIGTVTETLEAIRISSQTGWGTIISHRSGETEDTTVADLAVGTAAGQIKAGAPARGERTAKYNRLLRIEEELGTGAEFAGRSVYSRLANSH
jgi:enolase